MGREGEIQQGEDARSELLGELLCTSEQLSPLDHRCRRCLLTGRSRHQSIDDDRLEGFRRRNAIDHVLVVQALRLFDLTSAESDVARRSRLEALQQSVLKATDAVGDLLR